MRALIWALVLFLGPCIVKSATTITKTEGPGTIIVKDGKKQLRVDNGDDITLACTVEGDSELVSALWSGPDLGISFKGDLLHPDDSRFSIIVQRTEDNTATDYTIRIRDLLLEDEGNYRCQGISGLTDELQLFVTTAPNITSITDMQTAQVGEEVSLECQATGSPIPQIRWRHTRPNNKLPNGIEGEYKEGINLDIIAITLDDRGEYECIASNGVPDEEAQQTKKTYIRMDYQPTVEAIVDDNPVVKVPYGDSTSLTCKAMAYPRATESDVIWYFDDVQISESDGFTWTVLHEMNTEEPDPYNETTYSTLQITDVNSNSTGPYKCQFRNTRGTNSAVIQLEIGEREVGAITTETVTYRSMVPTPPDTGETKCCKASALSTSLVTIVTMLSGILWLVH